jgi:hypothetical protein
MACLQAHQNHKVLERLHEQRCPPGIEDASKVRGLMLTSVIDKAD